MPLLLLALDDTLLDRAGPFRAWASDFLAGSAHPTTTSTGCCPSTPTAWDRWDVAEGIRDRYGLRTSAIDLVEEIRDERWSRPGSIR